MSSIANATECDGHLVLYGVPWSTYTQLMELFADRHLRHSYDDETSLVRSFLDGVRMNLPGTSS